MVDVFKCPDDLKQHVKKLPDEALQWGVCFAKIMAVVMALYILSHAFTIFGLMFLAPAVLFGAAVYVVGAFLLGVVLKLRKMKKATNADRSNN